MQDADQIRLILTYCGEQSLALADVENVPFCGGPGGNSESAGIEKIAALYVWYSDFMCATC